MLWCFWQISERVLRLQNEITVLTVGKIKEKISTGCDCRVFQAPQPLCKAGNYRGGGWKTPDNASETVETNIKNKEAERLLKYIRDDAYLITLEIKGKQLTSEELAQKIDTLGVQGTSHIIFAIGGSLGLGEEVLKRSNYALSFRKCIPHQLMRVILLEQIYRSYRDNLRGAIS